MLSSCTSCTNMTLIYVHICSSHFKLYGWYNKTRRHHSMNNRASFTSVSKQGRCCKRLVCPTISLSLRRRENTKVPGPESGNQPDTHTHTHTHTHSQLPSAQFSLATGFLSHPPGEVCFQIIAHSLSASPLFSFLHVCMSICLVYSVAPPLVLQLWHLH